MIVFDLSCERQHRFEGWFASGKDFDRQLNGKLVTCPVCGSENVVRVPHAVRINTGARDDTKAASPQPAPPTGASPQYANLGTDTLTRLIDYIIETTEDVGAAFPEEARKIHYNEAPERHIRGTASQKDVEALSEEGIEVAALPIPLHRVRKAH